MSYLIKAATLSDGAIVDILIADGKIARVAPDIQESDSQIIEASGLRALSGLVDLHTHLREPGREDSETIASGSLAAVRGGYTALSAMANTSPVADTAGVVEQVFRLGQAAGLCDVFPIGAVTQGLLGEQLAEIGAMATSSTTGGRVSGRGSGRGSNRGCWSLRKSRGGR